MRTHAQLLAQLYWEMTSERLRNALSPDPAKPPCTPDDQMEAYLLAHRALNALGHAFDLNARLSQALDLAPRDPSVIQEYS